MRQRDDQLFGSALYYGIALHVCWWYSTYLITNLLTFDDAIYLFSSNKKVDPFNTAKLVEYLKKQVFHRFNTTLTQQFLEEIVFQLYSYIQVQQVKVINRQLNTRQTFEQKTFVFSELVGRSNNNFAFWGRRQLFTRKLD